MLRRKKKKNQAAPPDAADTAVAAVPADPQIGETDPATRGAPPAEAETAVAEATTAQIDQVDDHEPGRAAFAESRSPVPEFSSDDSAEYNPDSAEAVQRRPRYRPSAEALEAVRLPDEQLSVGFVVGSVQNVLKKSGESTAEERERQAAADFQAAIMPGLMGLRDAVPDAATPDEALQALTRREAEHDYPEDPESLARAQPNIFQTDASVYYRIRKRFDPVRRRPGWNNPWRPPPELARPDPPHRRALNRGD